MPTVKVENGYFLIEIEKQFNIDLKKVYTPLYFQTVQLFSENDLETNQMIGGNTNNQSDTFPYNYIVYMIEKNPISTAVKWIDLKGILNNALAKRTNAYENEKKEKMIEKENKKIEKENKKIEKEIEREKERENKEREREKEKETDKEKDKDGSGFFSNIKDWFKPAPNSNPSVDHSADVTVESPISNKVIDEKVEQIESTKPTEPIKPIEQSESIESIESTEPTESTESMEPTEPREPREPREPSELRELSDTFMIKIKMLDNIPHNGQSLNQILDTYKRSDRTIETFPESGLPYLLIEKLVYDIDNQQDHLSHIYDLHYSEFRAEYIYNINGHYVVFDSEKIKKSRNEKDLPLLIGDFVRKLISGGNKILEEKTIPEIENTRVAKEFM